MSDARLLPRERGPWVEGGALAALVLVLFVVGGVTVRTSYHGYLHTAIGEAVLRDGLVPENPWHAGAALRYYVLYPVLAVLTGRLGFGPLWAFALFGVASAFAFALALDAFGRSLGLSSAARRFAFLWVLLGLNALGWLWAGGLPDPALRPAGAGPPLGAAPLQVLAPMARVGDGFHWDLRLQSFVQKFLNVSSFAPALPFVLWALAASVWERGRAPWRSALHVGVATAINPLAGGFAGLLVAARFLPELRGGLAALRRLVPPAACAVAIALPFVLALLVVPAPEGGASTSDFSLGSAGPWADVLGPLILVWPLGVAGLLVIARGDVGFLRSPFLPALGLALAACFLHLPWGNQYKFVRLVAILLALPAGVASARLFAHRRGRPVAVALLLLALPSTWWTLRAYAAWDAGAVLPLTEVEDGRLAPSPRFEPRFPRAARDAEAALPPEAALLADPAMGAETARMGLVLGHPLAPMVHRALLVDQPQVHDRDQPDLGERLAAWWVFAHGRTPPQRRGDRGRPADAGLGLDRLRAKVAGRPLAVYLDESTAPAAVSALRARGAEERWRSGSTALWLLPPWPADDSPGR